MRIQLIGTLFTVASAGLAFGCGCSSETVRVRPVRECIIKQPSCIVERPLAVRELNTCPMPERRLDLLAPFRTVGHIVSAPFVAVGRTFSPSDNYIAPVGERLDYDTFSYENQWAEPRTRLMPVGERFTTVRTYRTSDLSPVGERYISVKKHHRMLRPVGEEFVTVKSHRKAMLRPVGEEFITVKGHRKAMLRPVGERTFSTKSYQHQKMLKSEGERTWIEKKSYRKANLKPVGELTEIQKGYKKTTLKPVGEKQVIQKQQKSTLKKSGQEIKSQ